MTIFATLPIRRRTLKIPLVHQRSVILIVGMVIFIHFLIYEGMDLTRRWKKNTKPNLEIEFSAVQSEVAQAGSTKSSGAKKRENKSNDSRYDSPEVKAKEGKKSKDKELKTGRNDSSSAGGDQSPSGFDQLARSGSAPTMKDTSPPRLLSNPKPQYPLDAYVKHQEGKVMLALEILETGQVGRVKLLQSSGVESIDEAAILAVRSWRFSPAQNSEGVVKQWIKLPIEFNLKK